MINVKVKVRYIVNADHQDPCEARVDFYLPASNYALIPQLRSREHRLCGECLWRHWGEATSPDERVGGMLIGAQNWEELQDIVRESIRNALSTLRDVYARWRELNKTAPPDFEAVYTIEEAYTIE